MHAIGEVWAQILWVVSQRLIAKHGYSDSLFPPEPLADGTIPEGDFYRPQEYDAFGEKKPLVPKHGNTLITQLVLNGMKLQPCRPSFFDARDAIIQADQVLTGGENFCELWTGFASRGLGPKARVDGRTPWGGGVRTNVSRLCHARNIMRYLFVSAYSRTTLFLLAARLLSPHLHLALVTVTMTSRSTLSCLSRHTLYRGFVGLVSVVGFSLYF